MSFRELLFFIRPVKTEPFVLKFRLWWNIRQFLNESTILSPAKNFGKVLGLIWPHPHRLCQIWHNERGGTRSGAWALIFDESMYFLSFDAIFELFMFKITGYV